AHRDELLASLDGYRVLAERDDMKALAGEVAHFFAIDPAAARQTFQLIWRPVHKSPTSAQQLGELAVVEATSGEPAAEQWPVVTHEMFHAWFSASPIAKQVELATAFIATKDPISQPAYAILDEVLATAFGNGMIARLSDQADYERRLAQPQGFYNDVLIDRVAKALLPALEKRLAAHGTIYDPDFVAEYLAAAHTAVKDWPPSAYLRDMTFLYTPALQPAWKKLQQAVNASYSDGDVLGPSAIANAQKHPGWGGVVLVSKKELDQLAPLVTKPQLAALKKQTAPAFVLAAHRQPVGALFVFVAPDADQMAALVDRFMKQPSWIDLLI
ncbi:MAG TPA: hypothetical protein VGC41_00765, partial [Kofleriaceae bacterium]